MDEVLKNKLKKVRLFVTDFDGVHTDGCVDVSQNGIESVKCSRRDSLGINMLKKYGIFVGVISKEANPVVRARCEKLNIFYYQAVEDGEGKRETLQRVMLENDLESDQVLYMGDDINDTEALKFAGVSVLVGDYHREINLQVDYICKRSGGQHAIREVTDMVLSAKGIDISKY